MKLVKKNGDLRYGGRDPENDRVRIDVIDQMGLTVVHPLSMASKSTIMVVLRRSQWGCVDHGRDSQITLMIYES
jgi:hypothetical protein